MGPNSGFNFQVGLMGGIEGCKRIEPVLPALQPDMARQACGCKQQRSKRDEKTNH